jgi:hypothetical protein
MEKNYKVYKPQSWEKKKEKRKNIDNICTPGTNISLDQTIIYTGTKLQRLWACF